MTSPRIQFLNDRIFTPCFELPWRQKLIDSLVLFEIVARNSSLPYLWKDVIVFRLSRLVTNRIIHHLHHVLVLFEMWIVFCVVFIHLCWCLSELVLLRYFQIVRFLIHMRFHRRNRWQHQTWSFDAVLNHSSLKLIIGDVSFWGYWLLGCHGYVA